jgi:peroxiredoxin
MKFLKRSLFFYLLSSFAAFCHLFILATFLTPYIANSQEIIEKDNVSLEFEQIYKPTSELLAHQVEMESFIEPKISLMNAEGEIVPLKNFRDKFVILYFFATWCSSCSEELKGLEKLKSNADFLDIEDFAILPISVDYKDISYIQSYYQSLKIKNLGLYLDPNKLAMGLLGVKSLPTTLFIDHKGNIFAKIDKNINWSKKEIINDILDLIQKKREQSKDALLKKQYDLKQDQDIIFNKETNKKVTIIN